MNPMGVFFLFFLMIASSSITTTTAVVNYDYSRLTLTWPKSFCLTKPPCKDITAVPVLFTVHGLWPDLLNGRIDPNITPGCSTEKLNPMALPAEVRRRGNQGWPDLQYYSKQQTTAEAIHNGLFWEREWVKHGVCSNLEPSNYVELALTLYDQVLPGLVLATNNLRQPRSVINVAQFTIAISDAAGYVPRLMCLTITHPPNVGQYLVEIQFNTTSVPPYQLQDMEQLTNCDSSRQVKFPQ